MKKFNFMIIMLMFLVSMISGCHAQPKPVSTAPHPINDVTGFTIPANGILTNKYINTPISLIGFTTDQTVQLGVPQPQTGSLNQNNGVIYFWLTNSGDATTKPNLIFKPVRDEWKIFDMSTGKLVDSITLPYGKSGIFAQENSSSLQLDFFPFVTSVKDGLKPATTSTLGGVIASSQVATDLNGVMSIPAAAELTLKSVGLQNGTLINNGVGDTSLINKKYVDDRAIGTLASAKSYADNGDTTTLAAAKNYANNISFAPGGDSVISGATVALPYVSYDTMVIGWTGTQTINVGSMASFKASGAKSGWQFTITDFLPTPIKVTFADKFLGGITQVDNTFTLYPGDIAQIKMTASIWRAYYIHLQMNGSGTKAPTYLTPQHVGYLFFETTKKKPYWWTGTGWVDATGAAATP